MKMHLQRASIAPGGADVAQVGLGPKQAKNSPTSPDVPGQGHNPLKLLSCFDYVLPVNNVCRLKLAPFGPGLHPTVKRT